MYQRGFEASNLTTEPSTTNNPVAAADAPEWDVVLAQEILDARASIVKEGDLELEAADLQERYELCERALGAAGTQPIDYSKDPHGSGPAHRHSGTMRS